MCALHLPAHAFSDPLPFHANTVDVNMSVFTHITLPQVPSEDWGGGYAGAADIAGEIPCRRMRSGSYIKAMGDDDSVDSDTSPKASPKSTLIAQRDAFRRAISMDQRSNVSNMFMTFMLEHKLLKCNCKGIVY